MGKVSPPPYVVVVSLQKSGTNLVAHMMADVFGYRCIGHGIRDSFDELLTRLHADKGAHLHISNTFSTSSP